MPLHKRYFIHYYRVSISEGLNTELSTSDLMLEKFDKYFRDVVFAIVQLKLRKLLLKKKRHMRLLPVTFGKQRLR